MFDIDTPNAAFQDQDRDLDGRKVARNLRDVADRPYCTTSAAIRGVNEYTVGQWYPSFYPSTRPEHADLHPRLHGAVKSTAPAAGGYARLWSRTRSKYRQTCHGDASTGPTASCCSRDPWAAARRWWRPPLTA